MSNRKGLVNVRISRDYFDENAHLSNTAYTKYFEIGRLELIGLYGLDAYSLKERNLGLYIKKSEYEYLKSINNVWNVNIKSEFERCEKGARINLRQKMIWGEQCFAESFIEQVLVNLKTGKPIRIPQDIVELLNS